MLSKEKVDYSSMSIDELKVISAELAEKVSAISKEKYAIDIKLNIEQSKLDTVNRAIFTLTDNPKNKALADSKAISLMKAARDAEAVAEYNKKKTLRDNGYSDKDIQAMTPKDRAALALKLTHVEEEVVESKATRKSKKSLIDDNEVTQSDS
jgi:hypothetical protein